MAVRVWIVNPFDNLPLEGNRPQRYWLMALAFARAGHDVTLWTSDFSHSRKAKRVFVREVEAPFRLRLVSTRPYAGNIGLARIRSHRSFARNWRAAAELETSPEVLVASMPPLALGTEACAYVARHAGVRLIVDVQDAWPETFERVVPRWMLAPLRLIARRIYRGAHAVSGVAGRYVELAKSYGAAVPTAVFPLAIEMPAVPPASSVRDDRSPLRLVYAGNMGASYDLATVIEGVKEMDGVELDLAGSGPRETDLRNRAAGCSRIRFHGYLGEEGLREFLASGDAALVPMFDASCVGVPGKLADYAAAGLPVLNTLHGETEQLLASCKAGFTYSAGEVASFRAVVERFRLADRAILRAGARLLASRFDAKTVYGGYVAWVERSSATLRVPAMLHENGRCRFP